MGRSVGWSVGRPAGRQAGRQAGTEGGKERWMEVLCENYNIAIYVTHVVCSPCSEPFSMLSQEFSHIPSLPYHAHVSERAKRA